MQKSKNKKKLTSITTTTTRTTTMATTTEVGGQKSKTMWKSNRTAQSLWFRYLINGNFITVQIYTPAEVAINGNKLAKNMISYFKCKNTRYKH